VEHFIFGRGELSGAALASGTVAGALGPGDDGRAEFLAGGLELFACTPDQIAATIAATVVSVGRDLAVLDAGSKTLTMTATQQNGFGKMKNRPRSTFIRLSEEHGVMGLDAEEGTLRVGDRVEVLPIHIGVCIDLQQDAYGTSRGRIQELIHIDAARRSR
jgi:D-serine deaminase-like pyridoxal phosphate-dependent protein